VIVMRLREGEQVSSLAPVVESGDDEAGTELDAPPPAEGDLEGEFEAESGLDAPEQA
jgi:hypothetical protein